MERTSGGPGFSGLGHLVRWVSLARPQGLDVGKKGDPYGPRVVYERERRRGPLFALGRDVKELCKHKEKEEKFGPGGGSWARPTCCSHCCFGLQSGSLGCGLVCWLLLLFISFLLQIAL